MKIIPQPPIKHSKLGIASCVIGMAMFLLMGALIGASYLISSFAEDHQQIGTVWLINDAVALFLPIPTHLIGLVLGIVGLFLPSRRILYPIVGSVLNLLLGIGSIWPWVYLAWLGLGRVQ